MAEPGAGPSRAVNLDVLPGPTAPFWLLAVMTGTLGLLCTLGALTIFWSGLSTGGVAKDVAALLFGLALLVFCARTIRRIRDRRPVLVIRPGWIALPQKRISGLVSPGGTPAEIARLRWSDVEVLAIGLDRHRKAFSLHLTLTAAVSEGRGVAVAHVPHSAPHLRNRIRIHQPLWLLDRPGAEVEAALLASVAASGARLEPAAPSLSERFMERLYSDTRRWRLVQPARSEAAIQPSTPSP